MDTFEYLEDEAIADIAFKAEADTLEGLFYQAALATANLQTDIKLLPQNETRTVKLSKSAADRLLKNFLDEIIYLKDAELFFVKEISVTINQMDESYHLEGQFKGGIFNFELMPMHNDLKAITWHNFTLEQTPEGLWTCYVLIDI